MMAPILLSPKRQVKHTNNRQIKANLSQVMMINQQLHHRMLRRHVICL